MVEISALSLAAASVASNNQFVRMVIWEDLPSTVFLNLLNLLLSVVGSVAKFYRAVVMSCAISVNSDVYLIAAPQISTFAAYTCVPELARSSLTSLNAGAK